MTDTAIECLDSTILGALTRDARGPFVCAHTVPFRVAAGCVGCTKPAHKTLRGVSAEITELLYTGYYPEEHLRRYFESLFQESLARRNPATFTG